MKYNIWLLSEDKSKYGDMEIVPLVSGDYLVVNTSNQLAEIFDYIEVRELISKYGNLKVAEVKV